MRVFIVSIDVEPDCTPTWHYSDPLRFRGVLEGVNDELHPLFGSYGIAPSYLVNNVVLEDNESTDALQGLPGHYELGAHLHPEFIAPEKQYMKYNGVKAEANQCHLPEGIELEKLRNITTMFEKKFGYRPSSFRAGRFSAGHNSFRSLQKLGYTVDSSVTPHVVWNDKSREKAIDYSDCPEQPFIVKKGSDPAGRPLLEVPLSIGRSPHFSHIEYLKSLGGLRRKMRKQRNIWLRPFFSSTEDMLGLIDDFIDRYPKQLTLNMMFHNVEIIPGLSPYVNNLKDKQKYLGQLKKVFAYLHEKNFRMLTLKQVYEQYLGNKK